MFVSANGSVHIGGQIFSSRSQQISVSNGRIEAPRIRAIAEVSGSGVIVADVENRNKVTVGNPIGVLTIQGEFSQNAALAMELAGRGSVAGVDFDQFVVQDRATFLGPIDVTTINNYTPAIGDSFELIRYGSFRFTSPNVPPPLRLPPLTADLFWSSNFGPEALTITVVPEPANWALAPFAFVGLALALRHARTASRITTCPNIQTRLNYLTSSGASSVAVRDSTAQKRPRLVCEAACFGTHFFVC
jgi:hypothetical protein